MTDLGNQQDVQTRNKAIQVRQGKALAALRNIAGTPDGVLFLSELVRETRMLDAQIERTDERIQFREGMRSIGCHIINKLTDLADPRPLAQVIAAVLKPEGETDGGNDSDDQ